MPPRQQAARGAPQPKAKTFQYRQWSRLNLTDARVSIEDDELAWLENAILVGKGSIQVLNAPGASVATISQGIRAFYGFTLNGTPLFITINQDGSVSQVTPSGTVTVVAAAGTMSGDAHCKIWQGTRILILDPANGYFSWDGATFTVISAGQTGTDLAVFEGRVLLIKNRTITYTAPNTFNDFTAANGAGSTILTDDAFSGNILAALSALEQAWLVGDSAIEALANITASGSAPNVTTTFSITNVVTNLGSTAQHSVIGYFRALALLAPFGAYALSGVTPQKLSDKLDGIFPQFTITHDASMAAVAVIQNLLCLLFRVTYLGSNAQNGAAPLPFILGFTQGKWFFAYQGALTWMASIVQSGVAQAWGTDGTHIFQLFGGAATTPIKYKVQSKFFDYGLSTTAKASMKAGLETQSSQAVAPTLTIESELASVTVPISGGNTLTIVNNSGVALQLQNNAMANLTIISGGMVLSRGDAPLSGHYLGWTLTGNDPPYRIQAVQLEVVPTREWSTP